MMPRRVAHAAKESDAAQAENADRCRAFIC
jgi:hypothetical protein